MRHDNTNAQRAWPAYNTIWRWHFYAGLFCIPFILLLSISGAIYLFKPQVEAALNQPYAHLNISGHPQSASAQIHAALMAVPSNTLNAYELPTTQQSAVQILLGKDKVLTRVYVHPETLAILKTEAEDDRFMRIIHELHGNLLIGDRGSYIVELAASWAIVMLITGLYLWWPSGNGIAGILYPRLGRSTRTFWRDLHAVTGFWISFFTLFLLLSGMPWTKSWGGMLKEVRQLTAGQVVKQDWTTGRSSALNERQLSNTPSDESGEHAQHTQHHEHQTLPPTISDYTAIDRMVSKVQALQLAPPVLISPPSKKNTMWSARSDAQNRPLRVNLVLDANSGNIQSRKNFADRPLFDRIIGIGVAVHEGQLFGWLNQLLGLLTALGLILLSVSAIILWWRRRSPGRLGAPPTGKQTPLTFGVIGIILTLGILLPFLGLSLFIVLITERLVLKHIQPINLFLGLTSR